MSDSWVTIESDPGVFTELISSMGVCGVQVEEIYELNTETLKSLSPVYGLIFLFKWAPSMKDSQKGCQGNSNQLYFSQQVIQNACATQAIVQILFNNEQINLGSKLGPFKSFTSEFDPKMKGLALSNSDDIRQAHNSFSRQDNFYMQEQRIAKDDDDVYHFISYIYKDGYIWELDGLKDGPIQHVKTTESQWFEDIQPIILQRMNKYSENEIRFSLMAVVQSRRDILLQQITELELNQVKLQNEIDQIKLQDKGSKKDQDQIKKLQQKIQSTTGQVSRYREELQDEELKLQKYRDENIRRKHNYIPFVFHFLRILAEKQQLQPLIEKAKHKSSKSANQSKIK